jgi:hypothetical protein
MEPLLTLVNLAFFAVCAAAFAKFAYYVIGEPRGLIGRPGAGEVTAGRIFSRYGVFVLEAFDKFEAKENKRLEEIYNNWYLEQQIVNGAAPDEAEIYRKNLELNRRRRANFYMAAGACFVCFSLWVTLIIWLCFYFLYCINILYLIVLIPTSAVISKRL